MITVPDNIAQANTNSTRAKTALEETWTRETAHVPTFAMHSQLVDCDQPRHQAGKHVLRDGTGRDVRVAEGLARNDATPAVLSLKLSVSPHNAASGDRLVRDAVPVGKKKKDKNSCTTETMPRIKSFNAHKRRMHTRTHLWDTW